MNCRFQDKRPGCFSITGTISGVFWGEVSVKIPGQSVLDSQEEIKEMKMTKKQEKKKKREKKPPWLQEASRKGGWEVSCVLKAVPSSWVLP